jgi:hypothetical protein
MGMPAFRGTPFSTPLVVCELQLLPSEYYLSSGVLNHLQIRISLATSGASVAVKRRAVEPVNKVKIRIYEKLAEEIGGWVL